MARLDLGIQFFAEGLEPRVPELQGYYPTAIFYLDDNPIHEKEFRYYQTNRSTEYYAKFISQSGNSVTVEFCVDGGESTAGYRETEQYTYDYGVDIEDVAYEEDATIVILEVYAISKQEGGTNMNNLIVNGTAVSSVIVNGKECNNVVCNGVTVFEKQSTESAVGTWTFNSTLTAPTSTFSYNIDFTSKSDEYSTIIYLFSATTPIGLCYGTTSSQVYTDTTSAWTDEMFKTITITGGTDATNSEFITWLKANATKSD